MTHSARIAISAAMLALAWTMPAHAAPSDSSSMIVYKSPTCGCCGAWAALMERAGFKVEVRDTEDMDTVKNMAFIRDELQACHTARFGDYLVEGHVPVNAVRRMLSERPAIRGIAVPGMPHGAPGMGDDATVRYTVYTLANSALAKRIIYQQIGE